MLSLGNFVRALTRLNSELIGYDTAGTNQLCPIENNVKMRVSFLIVLKIILFNLLFSGRTGISKNGFGKCHQLYELTSPRGDSFCQCVF